MEIFTVLLMVPTPLIPKYDQVCRRRQAAIGASVVSDRYSGWPNRRVLRPFPGRMACGYDGPLLASNAVTETARADIDLNDR